MFQTAWYTRFYASHCSRHVILSGRSGILAIYLIVIHPMPPPHLLICCSGMDTKKLGTQVDCCIIIIFRLITVVIILTNVFKCWSDLFQQCNTYHMRNFLDFRTSLSLCGGNPGFWDPFFWYGLGESVC